MRKHRFVTDDDIEESVQHDLAILREHFAAIGGWEDRGDVEELRQRVSVVEKHIGINKRIAA